MICSLNDRVCESSSVVPHVEQYSNDYKQFIYNDYLEITLPVRTRTRIAKKNRTNTFTNKVLTTNKVITLLDSLFAKHTDYYSKIPTKIIEETAKALLKIITQIREENGENTEIFVAGDHIPMDLSPLTPLLLEIVLLVKKGSHTVEKKEKTYIDKYEDAWISITHPEIDKYFILTVKRTK